MRTETGISSSDAAYDCRSLLARCLPGLALGLALSFAISLTMFIPPLYMLKLFSGVTMSGSVATIVGLSVLALGAVLLFCALDYLRSLTYQRLSAWLAGRLGDRALEPIATRTLGGTADPAELLKDIGQIRDFIAGGALTAGFELVWAPMFFFALFLLHPYFGWLGLAAGAVLLLLAAANDLLTRRPARESGERAAAAYREIGNALRFGESLEAMGMLRRLAGRWHRQNAAMIEASMQGAHRQAISASIAKGLRMSLQLAVFGGGMLLVVEQSAGIGSLLAASIIMVRALAPLEQILDRWRQWNAAASALRRLTEALEAPPRITRASVSLPKPRETLNLERVFFVPPGASQPVIRGVSLHLEFGRLVCIAGAAAAGKTTLLQLIAGLWKPTAGAVTVDGHDAHSWNREDFGHHIGYLPQSLELFGPTVHSAIARLTEGPPDAVIKAAKLAGIHKTIGRLPKGYDTDLETCRTLLSGGQKQQLAIARAFYGDPSLILLDEPDASLDRTSLRSLAATLRWLADRGRLVVATSHRMEMLQAADQVALLDQGAVARIVAPRVAPAALETATAEIPVEVARP
ncbi:MAG: ATP-binding cassette domain-containing protein [Nisaea sp.]|uniref:type I secretion system permease/ATPase n=1 Tax=Nisaea sp. TaxID=2024842 RepID=UPI001B0EDA14|nr:ATP-binding cassette domain-containing protein [Nisaea sp.]MBO6562327.1 ATP-binding cassette domain-containing protein [Nisaea sp.]